MHGNQEVFGTRLPRGQHGLHDDAVRRMIVGGNHDIPIGTQQVRNRRRDLVEPHRLLVDEHLIRLIDREGERLVLRQLLRAALRKIDPHGVEPDEAIKRETAVFEPGTMRKPR